MGCLRSRTRPQEGAHRAGSTSFEAPIRPRSRFVASTRAFAASRKSSTLLRAAQDDTGDQKLNCEPKQAVDDPKFSANHQNYQSQTVLPCQLMKRHNQYDIPYLCDDIRSPFVISNRNILFDKNSKTLVFVFSNPYVIFSKQSVICIWIF